MTSRSTPGLAVQAPARSHNDEAIAVRIAGAEPGEAVAFEATLVDDDGVEWSSRATFAADDEGAVDLADRVPASGDWSGVDPMAWCWAMTSGGDAPIAALGDRSEVEVTLRATAASGPETTRTATRRLYDDGLAVQTVDGPDLAGTLYEPPGDGPHPAVVSLHGAAGPGGADRTEKALATRGFATLALTYVGDADPVPDRLANVPLEYVERSIGWLRDRPTVADGPVGLFGVSRGAELALLVGARSEHVGAVVSYAGSGVVFDTPSGAPAWIDADGEPVPHLSGRGDPERTDDGEVVSRPVLERGLEAASDAEREAATIPVEAIEGPVLLVSGGDDRVWPARRLSAIAAARAGARDDADHRFAHLTHDDVGHLIGVPHVPLAAFDRGGGRPAATARLGAAAWKRTLATFADGLPTSTRAGRSVRA